MLANEELIPLSEVPDRLPKRRGKRVHYSSIYRWAIHGVRGRRLATLKIGGVLFTSVEALGRFISPKTVSAEPAPRSRTREADIQRANAVLDREGVR